MAFSGLCHLSNAYQTVENETDQSENIMDDSFVRDLIVNLLEDGPPSDSSSSIPPPENTLSIPPNQYRDTGTSLLPPYNYQNPLNFNLNDQNGFNYNMPNGIQNGLQNGFGNGFVNYQENDVNALLGVDLPDTTETVSQEQLNLLRLAAQEIGGAQFQSPNGNYNFFEPSQRNSLPETNIFSNNNFNRPTSLNLDMSFNNFDSPFNNRFSGNFKENQDPSEILSYLTQLNMSLDRSREENVINGIDFNKPEMNGHYEDFKAMDERNKMNQLFNRNFQQPNRTNENNHFFDIIQDTNRPPPNFDFTNQTPVSTSNSFKPQPNGLNGFHQDFMHGNQMQNFPNEQQRNFENNAGRENMQQMALMRQQELARQMSLFMRNRPPPNQLNVDVSYLHDNNHFNLGLGALLGPSPPHPPPVLPSPGIDIPLLAPFYAMRNIRNAATSSGVLHARLDMCYEQWRQLERERKRTEARLALAYPGRAVSSSNSIPVPRLPPCPTRVDRLTVDMLREHTKVLTLMGKMETLRAGVCVGRGRGKRGEEGRITVLRRGQEDVSPPTAPDSSGEYQPATWRDDVKHLSEIAPHKEVENAMLNWRNAVTNVQAARKRELHPNHHNPRNNANDPILQLADAVKNLCVSARRARCAMWCDLTLTVALAPPPYEEKATTETVASSPQTPVKQATPENTANSSKPTAAEAKEEKPTTETPATTQTTTATASTTATKPANGQAKLTDKEKRERRQTNYKKHVQRNDFYRNQRYDTRFIQNRHPYHYLATGPMN